MLYNCERGQELLSKRNRVTNVLYHRNTLILAGSNKISNRNFIIYDAINNYSKENFQEVFILTNPYNPDAARNYNEAYEAGVEVYPISIDSLKFIKNFLESSNCEDVWIYVDEPLNENKFPLVYEGLMNLNKDFCRVHLTFVVNGEIESFYSNVNALGQIELLMETIFVIPEGSYSMQDNYLDEYLVNQRKFNKNDLVITDRKQKKKIYRFFFKRPETNVKNAIYPHWELEL